MKRTVYRVIMIVLTLSFTAPLIYSVFMSFGKKQYLELILNNHSFFGYLLASVLFSAVSAVLAVIFSLPLGYFFAKVDFKFRDFLFFIYIIVMLLPFQATQLSGYLAMKHLNLINNPLSLILMICFSPKAVFLLRQCLKTMPDDIGDAFRLESGSVLKYIRYIILPYAAPMIATLFVLLFCEAYSLIEPANVYMPQNIEQRPLSSIISNLGHEAYNAGISAFLLPVVILYLALEAHVQKGMDYYQWN